MTDTKVLPLSAKLAAKAVRPKKKHWSHRRFMTLAFIAAGVVAGWLVWLTLISPWFREWRRAQDGANAADASNFLMLLFVMLLFAALGWYVIRRISNNHLETPKEASS